MSAVGGSQGSQAVSLQIPSIALAYEKAESDIMNRKPRDKNKDRLVNAPLAVYSYLHIGRCPAATPSATPAAGVGWGAL